MNTLSMQHYIILGTAVSIRLLLIAVRHTCSIDAALYTPVVHFAARSVRECMFYCSMDAALGSWAVQRTEVGFHYSMHIAPDRG